MKFPRMETLVSLRGNCRFQPKKRPFPKQETMVSLETGVPLRYGKADAAMGEGEFREDMSRSEGKNEGYKIFLHVISPFLFFFAENLKK